MGDVGPLSGTRAAPDFSRLRAAYEGRRVLVTGHTGFKGSWLSLWLAELGAEVTGFALPAATNPCLFDAARVADRVRHVEGDVRDASALRDAWREARPEIVFHLAAQSLVRESYADPLATLDTNVMGTAQVLEAARAWPDRLALLVVTSDKCYENREWVWAYRENDPMGGHDPYSMSKGAAELVVSSWRRSFFESGRSEGEVACATARAGNVIGGGDWAPDRIVPDCMRSLALGDRVPVRSPHAVRPWQHVLEPLSGYLLLGAGLLSRDADERRRYADSWNFGPETANARNVRELVGAIVSRWGSGAWEDVSDPNAPHEAHLLRLAIDKAHAALGWLPRWDFETTIAHTVDWYKAFYTGDDVREWCTRQIAAYMEDRE